MTLFAEHIGRGSGGEVVKTRQWPSGRVVAIKRLALEHRGDEAYVRRLRQEAAMVGGLDHENIVKLLRLDAPRGQAGRVALTMEYVDGVALNELMALGRLPMSAALHATRSILQALAYAHRASIVHRDISPRNVLIRRDGQVKLTDFGLARPHGCAPTSNGDIRGTLPYASPEQLKGRDADRRSELFAVGVLLHELVTGQRPWDGAPFEVVFALTVARKPLRPVADWCPWVSMELSEVIARLLAYDVEERYQCADDVLADLPEETDGREQLAQAVAAVRPARPRRRVPQTAWLAVALLAGYVALSSASRTAPNTESSITAPAYRTFEQAERASDVVELESIVARPNARGASDTAMQVREVSAAKPIARTPAPTARSTRKHARQRKSPRPAMNSAALARDPPIDDSSSGGSLDIPYADGGTVYAVPGESP